MKRWKFSAFFDWETFALGFQWDMDGLYLQEEAGRFRIFALVIGPIVLTASYRI